MQARIVSARASVEASINDAAMVPQRKRFRVKRSVPGLPLLALPRSNHRHGRLES